MIFAEVGRKIADALDGLVDEGLMGDLSEQAHELYKENYAAKVNPYGEAWAPRPGDEKRTASSPYFGKVLRVDRGEFSIRVAPSNARRSCVPFEPRGLGSWRDRFQDVILKRLASALGWRHV